MKTRTPALALLLLLAVASPACESFPTPGLGTPPAATPDIEATVRAAVQAALPAPVSDAPDVGATVIVSVRATVEAVLEATPVPSEIATPVAAATATPTSAPAPAVLPMSTPANTPTAIPAETAAPGPALAPAPTATLAPQPNPVSGAAFITAAVPAPTPTPPSLTPGGCQPAADGAVVAASVEGVWAASTTVRNGTYILVADQGRGTSYIGKPVTFKIGNLDANESGIWEVGGGDEIDLTAAPWRAPDPTPAPSTSLPVGQLQGGLLAQPVLPHVFLGKASICRSPTPAPLPTPTPTPPPSLSPPSGCQPAADGALVTAWVDGAWAASTMVRDGKYVLFVKKGGGESFAGKTVTFKIGDLDANESGVWEAGGGGDLDLTAAPWPEPEPTTAPASLLPWKVLPSGLLAQPVPPHLFLGQASICG